MKPALSFPCRSRPLTGLMVACLAVLLSPSLAAQDPQKAPTTKPQAQDPEPSKDPGRRQDPRRTRPVVVTATRGAKDPFDVPYSTSSLSRFDVQTRLQSRTTPEALKEIPGVSVQKTSHGQGSPKIRGQTGYFTLLLVDGIRINDSTWRSGNNEYWNQVDPLSFSRFEVLRGPSSVLWGSDAISGVGQAFQIGREDYSEPFAYDVHLLARYASAEDSWVLRSATQGNIGTEFGWHTGFSYKTFGDVDAADLGELDNTNYRERDGDIKLTFNISPRQSISVAMQQNHLKDVPRTHSTVFSEPWRGITPGSDLQREHDHRRQLYYLQHVVRDGSFFDSWTNTVAYKDRFEREDRTRSNGRRRQTETRVKTLGLITQLEKDTDFGLLTSGASWYHDDVDSDFKEFNVDGSLRTFRNRGTVAGDADYDMVGLFTQLEAPAHEDLDLILGVRWNYTNLSADDVDVPGDASTEDQISDHWNAVTGSARFVYKPLSTLRFFGGWTMGFRAPNLSDTTRFDVARSGEVEIPATDLDPEFYHTFEFGNRFDNGEFLFQGTAWYTIVDDQILRFRTGATVNGQPVVSKSNVGDGWYAGFELEGAWTLSRFDLDDWQLFGYFDYVSARLDQSNDAGVEVHDRPKAMPPPSGLVGLRWQHPVEEMGAEVNVRMAYHVNESRYTEADRNNTQRVPPDGLPGYAIVNLRGWYRFNEYFTGSVAIENLGDVDYRIMDSGQNEAGINVIVTLQARF